MNYENKDYTKFNTTKKLYSSSTKLKTLFNILSSCKNYVYSYPAYNYSSDINSSSETINMFFYK